MSAIVTTQPTQFEFQPHAKGRNGQDEVWELACAAMWAGQWGRALEMVQSLNAHFQSYAVDCLPSLDGVLALREHAAVPPERLADRLRSEVRAWDAACYRRVGLSR